MKYLRNPEIKKEIGIGSMLFLLSLLVGGCIGGKAGLLVAALTGFFFMLGHLLSSCYRYGQIARLSQSLNNFLHGFDIRIGQQKEGELSLLENEIGKLVLKLKNQTELLKQDKKYLADSIADISHQIRTPLTAMNLIVSRLSRRELPAHQQKKMLKELEGLLLHLDWLIQALLKISRLDAGAVQMKREIIVVNNLLHSSLEELAIPLEIREQTALLTCDDSVTYKGDEGWMKEAVMNIVKNCMDYAGKGGVIQIQGLENSLYTEIVIQDNGPGISKEDLPHLFERFYKGKNSGDKSVGIGLALAKMIVQQQGGVISAENVGMGESEKSGARFVIRFYKSTV
ncbi:MAG: HAMP domain-containing histidine kinase [Eubacterium sp.]|nr:HAMP domain-containing histidine kinase [Eubacterium sp.]